MSIAAANPFVDRWTRQGLEWTYLSQQRLAPRVVPAKTTIQLPIDDFTFKYPEGVLTQLTCLFDSPTLGVRLEQNPDLDTTFTPGEMAIGLARPEALVYALMPPDTPPGLFGVRIASNWPFIGWMRIHVVNPESVPHTLISHEYQIVAVKKKPDIENLYNLENLERIRLATDLYPERKKMAAEIFQHSMENWFPRGTKKEFRREVEEE